MKDNEIVLDKTKWDKNIKRKSNSPYSIYFYIKRGFDLEKAKQELKIFQNKNLGKAAVPTQLKYWINKGFTKDEAEIKRKEFQINASSKIKNYTENEKQEWSDKRKNTEIENLMEMFSLSRDEAYDQYKFRRKVSSPRVPQYWQKKGYSKKESIDKVSELQKSYSKRCIEYWNQRGFYDDQAIQKVSEYQDNNSIDSISKRYECSREEALDIQEYFIQKMLMTSGRDYDNVAYIFKCLYYKEVGKLTRRTMKLYKNEIDPENLLNKKQGYQLDHIFSIAEGFYQNISPEIISSVYNLRVITAEENNKKNMKCGITIEELERKYYENINKN